MSNKEWSERVENHLLDGVNIVECSRGWVWVYFPEWCGHRINDDDTRYSSYEKCINAVLYKMRNSPKLKYAKNMATAGIQYAQAESN